MSISYSKLFALMDSKGVKKIALRTNGIHPSVLNKIIKGGTITTETINRLCAILDCQPGDILEYVPDDEKKG